MVSAIAVCFHVLVVMWSFAVKDMVVRLHLVIIRVTGATSCGCVCCEWRSRVRSIYRRSQVSTSSCGVSTPSFTVTTPSLVRWPSGNVSTPSFTVTTPSLMRWPSGITRGCSRTSGATVTVAFVSAFHTAICSVLWHWCRAWSRTGEAVHQGVWGWSPPLGPGAKPLWRSVASWWYSANY